MEKNNEKITQAINSKVIRYSYKKGMLSYCKLFEEMVVQRKGILNREILSKIFKVTWKTEPQKLYPNVA